MKLHVRLFGSLRSFEPQGFIDLEVPTEIRAQEIKTMIFESLKLKSKNWDQLESLIESSALASEETLLEAHSKVNSHQLLALLPPVCGG